MKRSRLALVLILLAVAGLVTSLWVGEGPLWRLVMLKRVPVSKYYPFARTPSFERHPVRGWMTVRRWGRDGSSSAMPTPYGNAVGYYTESGFKAVEWHHTKNESRGTYWNPEGIIFRQRREGEESQMRLAPPWSWDMTNQTEPTAPWWEKEKAKRMEREER